MAKQTLAKLYFGLPLGSQQEIFVPLARQNILALPAELPDTGAQGTTPLTDRDAGGGSKGNDSPAMLADDQDFDFVALLADGTASAILSDAMNTVAGSDTSDSFIWKAFAENFDHPAAQSRFVHAVSALQEVMTSHADRFAIGHQPLVEQIGHDIDFGFAISSGAGGGGGGGGGKGRIKPAPTPTPEPTPTPTPTPITTPVSVDYTSGLDTPGGFNIGLVFAGAGWTDALKLGFKQAAEFLSNVITGDLPDVSTAAGVIDDIRITASLTALDGVGGTAGWGGYTAARSGSYLPSDGYVKMDTADAASWLANGNFDDLALHEMLHSLGFGTAWSAMGLVKSYSGDLRFTGANATKMYNDLFPLISGPDALSDFGVPVETDGGTGTAGVHWDDATFNNEVMTGWLGYKNVISDMTIAALQDMGYQAVYFHDFSLG